MSTLDTGRDRWAMRIIAGVSLAVVGLFHIVIIVVFL